MGRRKRKSAPVSEQGAGLVSEYELAVKKCKRVYATASIIFGGLTVIYVAIAALLPFDIAGRIVILLNAVFTAVQMAIYLRLWTERNRAG